jgi:hypothetical protein
VTANFSGVGTLNYDLEVNPSSGVIYVTNHQALNLTRFENNLRDNFARMQVTIINPLGPTITPIHLNPHINYAVVPGSQAEIDQSLSCPMDMVWNSNGTLMYMTALGSGKVAVVTPGRHRGGPVGKWPTAPTGLALDENRGRLYVLDRFAEKIRCVALSTGTVVQLASLGFNPEPPEIQTGRKFLYDARLSSGHGDVSCATCHAFANFDGLAWDLGRPDGQFLPPPDGQLDTLLVGFHPMKGPDGHPVAPRPARYRPRTISAAIAAISSSSTWRSSDLMGRDSGIPGADLMAFNDFIQTVTYPPNPNENLDRSLPNPTLQPSPQRGKNAFTTLHLDDGKFCVECHEFPAGTNNQITSAASMGNTQDLNVSQLRNLYEKTGYGRTGALKNGFGFTAQRPVGNLVRVLQAALLHLRLKPGRPGHGGLHAGLRYRHRAGRRRPADHRRRQQERLGRRHPDCHADHPGRHREHRPDGEGEGGRAAPRLPLHRQRPVRVRRPGRRFREQGHAPLVGRHRGPSSPTPACRRVAASRPSIATATATATGRAERRLRSGQPELHAGDRRGGRTGADSGRAAPRWARVALHRHAEPGAAVEHAHRVRTDPAGRHHAPAVRPAGTTGPDAGGGDAQAAR